jgi:hypothetical protein
MSDWPKLFLFVNLYQTGDALFTPHASNDVRCIDADRISARR